MTETQNECSTAHAPPTTENLYDVLEARGLLAQCTDAQIRKRLETPVVGYIGFDPTADSLHVGSLVQVMTLAHVQRCGHRPLVLVGGATGLVGDPSGKTDARQMLAEDQVRANADAIAAQIGKFLRFADADNPVADPTGALLVNNIDWIAPLTWLEVLREVGSRVSVNRMVSMESVKQRMNAEGAGISYLEFSYMLLQALDFVRLFERHGCTLQLGGQDQWGNIVMGIELGRKMHDADLAGLTTPLITKADGAKFGKSESGNVWLDPARTSPWEFFQFWRNVDDSDVGRFLGFFTFLSMAEIRELTAAGGAAINAAKERLAFEVTRLVHGPAEADKALASAKGAFAGGDAHGDSVPSAALSLAEPVAVIKLIQDAGFAKSNGEAKRLITGGGVRIGDAKITDLQATVSADDAAEGHLVLRVGKKKLFRFDTD